jgi:hypothetical protein
VRTQLRKWFEEWGLPKAIRVDNGDPWATRSDIPSALALWLTGLGVKVLLNRPRHSTDNGIVERDHGVLARWVEADKAPHRQGLQQQLDWAMRMQRERYPAIAGQSRLHAYPDLQRNPRSYSQVQEAQLWDIQRVYDFIGNIIWTRRVDKVGRVSLFSTAYSVGRASAGQQVNIHFDIPTREWVIENEQGHLLKRYLSQEITPERIQNLNLAKRANWVSPAAS